jgi:hypothetical protein
MKAIVNVAIEVLVALATAPAHLFNFNMGGNDQ